MITTVKENQLKREGQPPLSKEFKEMMQVHFQIKSQRQQKKKPGSNCHGAASYHEHVRLPQYGPWVRASSFASIARCKLYWAQAPIREMMDATATAYHSTAEIWDDGIIDPRDTRDVLGMAISAALNSDPEPDRGYGVFRM